MTFNHRYFIAFIILFIIEVFIAFYIKQPFIRFIFGDFLIVIMLYYLVRSFSKAKPIYIAIAVLIFAFVIEFLQLTNLLEVLGLENNKLAGLILGNTFEINDIIAYTLGIITVLIIEKVRIKKATIIHRCLLF